MSEETSKPDTGRPGRSVVRRKRSWKSWYLFLVFLMAYTWAYLFLGTILVVEKNSSRLGNVQAAHIESVYQATTTTAAPATSDQAMTNRATRFLPHYTDGISQPLWP